jgi:biotin operon repressor
MENQLDTVRIADLAEYCNSRSKNTSRSDIFVRKDVAASGLVAEKKIDYALLDNTLGFPGHLGALNDHAGIEDLATKIGRQFGSGAEAYWRKRYRSRKAVERLIADFREWGLIDVAKRHHEPALYRLHRSPGNQVLGSPRKWLDGYFAGDRSGLEMLVLMDLQSRAGDLGIFPCQRTIADDIGVSEASVQRALRSLRSRGEITVVVRPGRRHNSYLITISSAQKNSGEKTEYPSQATDALDRLQDSGHHLGRIEPGDEKTEAQRAKIAPAAEVDGITAGVITTGLTSLNPVKTTPLEPYNQILEENQIQMRALSKTRGIVATAPRWSPACHGELSQAPVLQLECSDEEFEDLRQVLFRFVTTDWNWSPTPTPEWVEGPPDDMITWKIAAAGGGNIPFVISCLRSLKDKGKTPNKSYGFFVRLVEARAGALEKLPRQSERADIARSRLSKMEELAVRTNVESELRPFRGRMTVPQIALLETQYSGAAVLQFARLPRLSIFYAP